jgi:Excalibur calcium-binding domain
VDGTTNEAKSDGDAATWLPPNKAYRCAYVARQVAVKARYGLWLTAPEHDAIATVLARCPGQKVPTESGAPASAPRTSTAPRARSTSTTSAHRSTPSIQVTIYANCAELNQDYPHGVGRPGAHDHTSSGSPVTSFTINAAVYDANTGRDGDHDGVACEQR